MDVKAHKSIKFFISLLYIFLLHTLMKMQKTAPWFNNGSDPVTGQCKEAKLQRRKSTIGASTHNLWILITLSYLFHQPNPIPSLHKFTFLSWQQKRVFTFLADSSKDW